MAMEFAAWLRRQLARRDWTQADFARAAGLPTGTVSRWVRGERVPTPLHADLIADVLGVDLDIVLAVAGHRPNVDPDDPPEIADLIAMIRKTQMHPDRVAGLALGPDPDAPPASLAEIAASSQALIDDTAGDASPLARNMVRLARATLAALGPDPA